MNQVMVVWLSYDPKQIMVLSLWDSWLFVVCYLCDAHMSEDQVIGM